MNQFSLKDISSDKLSFKTKAEEIATFINDYPTDLPCSISLNGPWGSGKSTMLNFIASYLSEEKCSVIRFNPWMVTDRDSLVTSLFEEIYYELGGKTAKVKQAFAEYSEKLLPSVVKALSFFTSTSHGVDPKDSLMVANTAGDATKSVGEILFNTPLSKRKKALQKEMEEASKNGGKKIVIIIDELDRLFPDEIITVFQMINSSLDFPGLFFVVAMDNNAVHDALKKKGISNPDYYLQKIFQRNYVINTKYQLRTLVNNFLLVDLKNENKADKALKDNIMVFLLEEESANATGDTYNRDSYKNVRNSWREVVDLENPRKFMQFSYQVKEMWPGYYKYISEKGRLESFILGSKHYEAAFLILFSHLIHPLETETKNFYLHSCKGVSAFTESIAKHFWSMLQYKDPKISQSTVHPLVSICISYLHQFPDHVTDLQLADGFIPK